MILYYHLDLLVFRKLRIKLAEHFLCIEASRYKEDEMRRFLWNCASEFVGILPYLVRIHGDSAFIFVSYEDNLLDVACKPLLLDISPLFLLRIGSAPLVEEHISYRKKQDKVQPGDIKSYSHGFLPARCLVVFCHIPLLISPRRQA